MNACSSFRWAPGGVAALLVIGAAWRMVMMLALHPEVLTEHEND